MVSVELPCASPKFFPHIVTIAPLPDPCDVSLLLERGPLVRSLKNSTGALLALLGVGAAGFTANVAVTFCAAAIGTTQLPVPEHDAPLQPLKKYPPLLNALSLTDASGEYEALQVEGQLILPIF